MRWNVKTTHEIQGSSVTGATRANCRYSWTTPYATKKEALEAIKVGQEWSSAIKIELLDCKDGNEKSTDYTNK